MSSSVKTTGSYGFDFLRAEHNERSVPSSTHDDPENESSSESVEEDQGNVKTPLEKQFDVLNWLQKQKLQSNDLTMFTTDEILQHTGIDLAEDGDVAAMLESNPRVLTKFDASLQDTLYMYQSKFQVSNKQGLLALVNRCKNGICAKDLSDAYKEIEGDLAELICSGEIIAVANSEQMSYSKDKTLFPRGEAFLVELDGNIDSIKDSSFVVQTDRNLQRELRRGEAVWVGGQWCRVSSAVRDGVPLSEQPPRAQAPLSVTSINDMSKKNEVDGYCRPFTEKQLPLDREIQEETLKHLSDALAASKVLDKLGGPPPSKSQRSIVRKRPTASSNSASISSNIAARTTAAANPDLAFRKARRHGCSKDIREMYLATRAEVPESEIELHGLLVTNKLLEKGEAMRRPRIRKKVDNTVNGKAKKKRYYVRKGHKITNTHLAGTEIGAVLAMASERQQQGKDVGDGGM